MSAYSLLDLYCVLKDGNFVELNRLLMNKCNFDDDVLYLDIIFDDFNLFSKEKWNLLFSSGLWERVIEFSGLQDKIIKDVVLKNAVFALQVIVQAPIISKKPVVECQIRVFNELLSCITKAQSDEQKEMLIKVTRHFVNSLMRLKDSHILSHHLLSKVRALDNDDIRRTLQVFFTQTVFDVPSLQHVCRHFIRNHFIENQGNVLGAVSECCQFLPQNVCSYLLFK